MNVPVRLTVFAVSAAMVFAAAFGVGSLIDPIAASDDRVDVTLAAGPHGGHGETAMPPTPTSARSQAVAELPGLAVSQHGYTLRVRDPSPGAGEGVQVAFDIESPDGGPVLNFAPAHEKEMHLIVVRRDLVGFQHLHPERDAAGTWRVPVDLHEGGAYRMFADFTPTALGEPITLGADLFVPGEFTPAELPEPAGTWSGEDYGVALSGSPSTVSGSELSFTVSVGGSEVRDLDPYLGAFGHLVALRSGDLAYLHTHPVEEATAGVRGGPTIRFVLTFPSPGRYRLYLNFADVGVVRTAEFTVDVPVAGAAGVPR